MLTCLFHIIYCYHRCYCALFVARMLLSQSSTFFNYYFIFSSGMLNNILSQMCGRLYFPIFLLSVGLFTLMYIDSLIVLAKLLSSLPIILKFSMDVSWPLMFWYWNTGEGAFKCSLYLSPNVLPDSPMYSSPQSMLPQE